MTAPTAITLGSDRCVAVAFCSLAMSPSEQASSLDGRALSWRFLFVTRDDLATLPEGYEGQCRLALLGEQ